MRNIVRRLISEERHSGDFTDTEGRAAFRVCDKLRDVLSGLTGTRGYRALLARALTLAQAEAPWLAKLEVENNGLLRVPVELEREVGPKETAKGGAALVAHLLELLGTFIGEALTLRLVQQVWPQAAISDSKSGDKA